MRTQRDRMMRVRDRLHTATQNISESREVAGFQPATDISAVGFRSLTASRNSADDSVNLDLQEHGETIFVHVNREVIGILLELHDGDLKELHDAVKEYVRC